MPEKRAIPISTRIEPLNAIEQRQFEAESAVLQSLRLIAAPNPKDDLSKEQLIELCKGTTFSPVLIWHLIEFIKTI
jgi:hypothetical protein